MSAPFSPAARTATRTSVSPGTGSGRGATRSSPFSTTTARIALPAPRPGLHRAELLVHVRVQREDLLLVLVLVPDAAAVQLGQRGPVLLLVRGLQLLDAEERGREGLQHVEVQRCREPPVTHVLLRLVDDRADPVDVLGGLPQEPARRLGLVRMVLLH